eukprot:scaffold19433_cov67-Phaeocystis_antarctica.AAC.3
MPTWQAAWRGVIPSVSRKLTCGLSVSKRSTAGLRSSWSSRRFTMRPGEGEGEGEGGGKAIGRIAAVRITVGLFSLGGY